MIYKHLKRLVSTYKYPLLASVVFVIMFIILFIIISFINTNQNRLTPNEQKQEQAARKVVGNSFNLTKTLVSENDWSLAELTSLNNNRQKNLTMFIFKGDQVISSGTSFMLDQLIDLNVPDKIIEYFYKKPWDVGTINLKSKYSTNLDYNIHTFEKYLRPIIQVYANNNNINIERIDIKKDSFKYWLEDGGDGIHYTTGGNSFVFTINQSNEQLILLTKIYKSNERLVQIMDNNGKVLFEYTYKPKPVL